MRAVGVDPRSPFPPRALSHAPVAVPEEEPGDSKISRSGWVLAFATLLLALSAFPMFRVEIDGLQVHPINFAAPIILLIGLNRLRSVPQHITASLFLVLALFSLTALIEPRGTSVTFKFAASMVIVFAGALGIRTRADFRAIGLAFVMAAAAISLRGLVTGDLESPEGINPLQGIANKNAFSMYLLPAVLIGAHTLVTQKSALLYRWLLIGGILLTILATFSSGNRSGWLGMIAIGAVLGLKSIGRIRNLLLISVIVVTGMLLIENFGNTRVIEVRANKTEAGYSSDSYRLWILEQSLEIGWEHPLLGVSPQRIPTQVAIRSPNGFAPSTHNVFATIFAGGGFSLVFAFLILALSMWFRPAWGAAAQPGSARHAHSLLRIMLVLWCLRGFFSEEILYSPAFSLGIGLCLGLCCVEGVWRSDY